MAVAFTTEEKVHAVIEGMEAGETREVLAKNLGYKDWRGIDVLMRRKGYVYRDDMYVLPEQANPSKVKAFVPQPVRIVLQQLKGGNKDLSSIAGKAGFKERRDLAEYMKAQGWVWSPDDETYLKESQAGGPDGLQDEKEEERAPFAESDGPNAMELDRFLPLLQFLEKHRERLEEVLLGQTSSQIPQYRFPAGPTVTKSVSMGSNLDQLVRDFSLEMGVSQRLIFEAALIQFMERYGYEKQVKALLKG